MKREIYDICEKEATTISTPILISFSNHYKNKKEVSSASLGELGRAQNVIVEIKLGKLYTVWEAIQANC